MGKNPHSGAGDMSHVIQWMTMGGYFIYIWPAYGIVFFVLAVNLIRTVRQKKRTFTLLNRWYKGRHGDS